MRKTRGLLLVLLGMFVFFTAKSEALAATDLEREYYVVVEGTAQKLGEEEQKAIAKNAYIEEWRVPDNCELAPDVADVLLKATNADQLPISVTEKLNNETLKKLAEAATEMEKNDVLYQGYARLGIEEANAGYTYGILIHEGETLGTYSVSGYYAELNRKAIYKINLTCRKSSNSEIFKEVQISSVNSNSSNSSEEKSPETPSKPGTPNPPSPPVNPPIPDGPEVPEPVIPGPSEEEETPSTPSTSEIPAPPSTPALGELSTPNSVIPGVSTE